MTYFKITFLLFIFFTSLCTQQASAQRSGINGDTILVNRETEVQIVFPTVPKQFTTLPENTSYRVWEVKNGIYLIAGAETADPVTLSISEGERNHRFILVFNKDLDNTNAKLYYDYSTEKKLEQHIRITPSRTIASEKIIVKTEPILQDEAKEKSLITAAVPADSSLLYYAILEQGDKDLKLQNYQAASASFNKAHILRPDDKFPTERLLEIKGRIAERAKLSKGDNEKEYKSINAVAVKYLDQRKYAEAQEAYIHALEIKPGDPFVTSQLQTLNSYLQKIKYRDVTHNINGIKTGSIAQTETSAGKQQLTDEDNYKAAVKSAYDFFKAGNYDSAKTAYNKALIFIKKDWPKDQIIKINKIQNDEIAKANADKEKLKQQQDQINKIKNDEIAKANADKEKLKQQQDQINKIKNDEIVKANADKEKLKQQQDQINKIKNDEIAKANADKEKLKQQQDQIIKIKNDEIAKANADKENLKQQQDQIDKIKNDEIAKANADKEKLKQQQEAASKIKSGNESVAAIPKNQPTINESIEDSSIKTEIEIKYVQAVHVADSLTNFKAFDSAIAAYRRASLINPLESYPRKQIRYLQSELTQLAKKKREDDERRHIDAITRADKAVASKNYEEAKTAYTEALSIHSDNEYAQRRLQIILFQIEKATAAEKLRQDSLNVIKEVPVKKSGRKRS